MFRSSDNSTDALAARLQRASHPLDSAQDLDPLLERIGDARYVLLGEASHGTSEFYTWRARAHASGSSREKGFSFVAVEGDWPDCYRVNRYVKGYPDAGHSARDVLHAFERWPTWMWANREIVALAEWLREHNARCARSSRSASTGSTCTRSGSRWAPSSSTCERIDPQRRAQRRGAPTAASSPTTRTCRSTRAPPRSCRPPARTRRWRCSARCGARRRAYREDGREAYFNAEQNALVARERRALLPHDGSRRPDVLERARPPHGRDARSADATTTARSAKAIVWEHNTHIGDARSTDMARAGMVNVGQLVREAMARRARRRGARRLRHASRHA